MIFDNIIGNEKNKELLINIIKENKVSNAYMFIGQDSIGKLLFAKQFAVSEWFYKVFEFYCLKKNIKV